MIPSPHSLLVLCFAGAFLAGAATAAVNYRDALAKSIIFFQGQKSGKLPKSDHPNITWRGNSALTDGQTDHVNLTGGYYDAGDNVKFNLPMAFTTTILSWGAIEYAKRLTTELKNTHAAIRWATDYLIKCATAKPGVLYAQVGNPYQDHSCWERPEDMDTDRTAYSVTRGSDLAGETAAALAAASIVFRKADPAYSRKLLKTAKNVMQFAVENLGAYSDELKGNVCPFYCSYSGYKDELLWGAAWMLQATNDYKYLNYINTLGANDDSNIFSWDNKYAGARVLLSKRYLLGKKEVKLQPFNQQAESFVCSILPGGGTTYTPGGLMYKIDGSNLQYVTAITFLLTTYAKYMAASKNTFTCGGNTVTKKTLRDLARKQVDYILGDNPMKMSYMVGFGENYPKRIHHRGASLPSIYAQVKPVSCGDGFAYMRATTPDPNLLIGAVVGGPDRSDHFAGDPENYAQSEPTTYINAALVGPLAYFASSTGKHK